MNDDFRCSVNIFQMNMACFDPYKQLYPILNDYKKKKFAVLSDISELFMSYYLESTPIIWQTPSSSGIDVFLETLRKRTFSLSRSMTIVVLVHRGLAFPMKRWAPSGRISSYACCVPRNRNSVHSVIYLYHMNMIFPNSIDIQIVF